MPRLLAQAEIDAALAALNGWTQQGNQLVREYRLADFRTALAFVNAVAELAEAADHHPDILLHGWNRVRVALSTHSAGGITENDSHLAEDIDNLPTPPRQ